MTRIIVVVIALVMVPMLALGGNHAVATAQGAYCATEAEAEVLRRINELRQDNGLGPLTLSVPLGVAAQSKANDMAERDYMAHVSLDGQGPRDLLTSVGYPTNTATGENLAAGNQSAGATFEQWLNSPTHLEIMLYGDFVAVGIGSAYNADSTYGWYWAAEFGGVVGEPAGVCGGAPDPPAPPADVTSPSTSVTDALIAAHIAILLEILGG